jgi:hypothetical protein
MLYTKSKSQKLVTLLFLFSVHLCFATDFKHPFTQNKGQFSEIVIAKVNLPGGALFIEKGTFTYNFYDQQKLADIHNHRTIDRSIKAHAFKVIFKNANENIESLLEEKSIFFENYFLGNNKNYWAENVHHYKSLTQKNIYDGIDLKMYSQNGNLKYDMIVKANSNPKKVKLSYEEVDNIFIKNGNLYVQTSVNTITEQKPNWHTKPEILNKNQARQSHNS